MDESKSTLKTLLQGTVAPCVTALMMSFGAAHAGQKPPAAETSKADLVTEIDKREGMAKGKCEEQFRRTGDKALLEALVISPMKAVATIGNSQREREKCLARAERDADISKMRLPKLPIKPL